MTRLRKKYLKETVPVLLKELNQKSPMAIPRLLKITVNMGVGEGASDAKIMAVAVEDMKRITGQAPSVRLSKKAEASFKLRKGVPVGCAVTLRRKRMYEFFDRLVSIAIPRIRDFRGLNPKSFDGTGNYSFGIKDQTIFIEISSDKVDKLRGMDVTIVTSAKTDRECMLLLKNMGMPFQREN